MRPADQHISWGRSGLRQAGPGESGRPTQAKERRRTGANVEGVFVGRVKGFHQSGQSFSVRGGAPGG